MVIGIHEIIYKVKAVYPVMQAKGFMEPIDWEANLSPLYYDQAGGATPEVVKTLLTTTTPDHLLYGSDYPCQPERVLTAIIPIIDSLSISQGNPAILFRIPFPKTISLFATDSSQAE